MYNAEGHTSRLKKKDPISQIKTIGVENVDPFNPNDWLHLNPWSVVTPPALDEEQSSARMYMKHAVTH